MLTLKIFVAVALCCAYAEAVAIGPVAEPPEDSIPCSCKVCRLEDCPVQDCPQVICAGSAAAEPDPLADNTQSSAAELRPFPSIDNCVCEQCEEDVICPETTCPSPCPEVQP